MTDDSSTGSGRPGRNGPWRVHSTETSFANPWIRIETSRVTHPGGADGIYGVVRYANLATGVLPLDEEGHTWLVGQHRFPFDAYSWELPEGGGRKGVSPQASAARELEEEAGLIADHWLEIGQWHLSNSVSDEVAFGYVAWGLSPGKAEPESSEDLTLERVPFGELVRRCLSGEIADAFTHLMVFAARERARRGELPAEVARFLVE
ncbi:MAG: NUDIX hydrolase [Henriciella sp.]|uniref:NUDIX domain-containing protein n=1 Tax=Henriciella sp. TaxID=1968823 RepID=UPI003C78748F